MSVCKRLVGQHKLTATIDTVGAYTRERRDHHHRPDAGSRSDKRPDLSFIVSVGQAIAQGLSRDKLVVLESTVFTRSGR